MAVLTLLDLAKRNAGDAAVGLVEEVLTVAPELQTLPVVPKDGTSYQITRRTGRPRGAFRSPNEGVEPGKSKFETAEVPMYFFDGQMVIDEAIVRGDNKGSILANEGAGQLQETYVQLGDQIYRGSQASTKGFYGLKEQVDPSMIIDADGTGAATHTAWAVYENPQNGLHLPIGNDGAVNLGEWRKQQVLDESGKAYMAWVNNLAFWIGLALGSRYCIGCIKNITSTKPLTDELGNHLASKFPVGRKPTRWFISRDACFYLQKTRSAIGQVADNGGGEGFAPRPTSLADVPITETDSIITMANW